MIRSLVSTLVACALAVCSPAPATAAGVMFTPLGFLSGGTDSSQAHGVSADGSLVVGYADTDAGDRAFVWSKSEGMVNLGSSSASRAYSISGDGTVIGGHLSGAGGQAFRWTEDDGFTRFGPTGAASGLSRAVYGISHDGSILVGMYQMPAPDPLPPRPVLWTADGDVVPLGTLPTGPDGGEALAVTPDGSIVVGWSATAAGGFAIRWTESEGMVPLTGALIGSRAFGVSADGSVVVGHVLASGERQAFRWTEGDGMVIIGDLPGGSLDGRANAVSADGSVIVGRGNTDAGDEAFYWTEATGMLSLQDYLLTLGVDDVLDWQLSEATAISADGRTIVGLGINPSGNVEAWVVTIPEPSSIVLALCGVAGALLVARGRRR